MKSLQRTLKWLITKLIGKNRTRKVFVTALILLLTLIIISICVHKPNKNIGASDYFYKIANTFYRDDNSCYKIKDYNNNSADSILFRRNSIFFIRTSCEKIKFHEACSIESAATKHVDKQINVLFTSPTPKCYCQNEFLEKLLTLTNVEFYRIYLETYILKTPIEYRVIKHILRKKRCHTILKEILKMITLYKYGGIMIDLNVILARSLYALTLNFAAREDQHISTAVVAVQRRKAKRFMAPVLRLLNNQTHIDEWSSGRILTDAFKNVCLFNKTNETPDTIFTNNTVMFITCRNDLACFFVYSPHYFHYIKRDEWYKYYEDFKTIRTVVGYNLYTSEHSERTFSNKSLYAKIAQNNCPTSYEIYLRRFE